MPLTADQDKAFKEITTSIEEGKNHVLMGYAGTGKTYLCQELSKYYPEAAFCASTNKAVRVLEEKLLGQNCETVHRLLKLKFNKGKLAQYALPCLEKYEVIFVDECSMVNKELYEMLLNDAETAGTPVVFVGDPAQLPPVGEVESETFSTERRSKLEEIVRQAKGNPIIPFSFDIRTKGFHKDRIPVDNEYIFVKSVANKYKVARKVIENGGVYAAWTNRTVNDMNFYIHNLNFGKDADDFCPGEVIVMGQPYVKPYTGDILANNGDQFTVKSVVSNVLFKRECWVIDVEEDPNIQFYVLKRQEAAKIQIELSKLREMKQWGPYFELKETFADVRHTYAFTCHKLQGTTVDIIVIDVMDIMCNRKTLERNQLMYVALTRAARKACFLT